MIELYAERIEHDDTAAAFDKAAATLANYKFEDAAAQAGNVAALALKRVVHRAKATRGAFMPPYVGDERTPPARWLGREAMIDSERLAAKTPCRWRSARAKGG